MIRLGRAWTTFRGRRLRILEATGPADATAPGGHAVSEGTGATPGSLDGGEVIAGNGTRLRLVAVQPEGKRAMAALDWLHGVRPGPGDALGE